MFVDFVINDGSGYEGHGPVGEALGEIRYDTGLMRPYIDRSGRRMVTVNTGRTQYNEKTGFDEPVYNAVPIKDLRDAGIESPVFNATSLRKDDWIKIDTAVVRATRQRLRAWADLAARNSVGGFDAMATMTYEYEAMSDEGEAVVDMDTLSDARQNSPLFKLRSVPLPITWAGFWFSKRRLAASQRKGQPLNVVGAEAAGRRVAEMIEKTLIGTETGMALGGLDSRYDGANTVYGYTNFPYRMTKTDLTTPTGSNPEAVKQDVIEMREQMYAAGFYGPFMLYTSTGYDAFLDDDYFRSGSTAIQRTTRERIMSIDGIMGIKRLDYLTSGYQMILVQMDPEVVQAIDGMGVTTVQWESHGGGRLNFKVMAIQVPLFKAPYNGVAGIVHATTS